MLCLFCFSWPGFVQASNQNCANRAYDESATVKYVNDGDTIKLLDGRKIRLIGINTPELARDGQAAEAYALQARDRLRSLLQEHNNHIKLIYGREKQDHYQRSLAHIFLADGSNLQAQLISDGLANAITIPPNDRYTRCYHQIEKKALCQKKGLWSQKTLSVADLDDSASGFHVLRGKLKNIK
ncbi:MAG: thermonuclease family protein, partial [Gammaproteobacteria bacterium]|nr:thermonuclease family protein [Gammaproteobacteria bacterium]